MVNKAIIVGNLGAAPEVRYTTTGKPVTSFSVATTERWKDGNGEVQESTEWHRVIAWNRLGEICGEYLGVGSKVYIEGKIVTRKWQDNDGVDRYTTEIVAREMKMLSPKSSSSGSAAGGDNDSPLSDAPPIPDADDVPF